MTMRTFVIRTRSMTVAVLTGPFLAATMSYACIKPSHVATALEAAEVACILINDAVEDEALLAKACNISSALIPEIRKIIFARKAAIKERQKAAATASVSCAPASTPVAMTSSPLAASASASSAPASPAKTNASATPSVPATKPPASVPAAKTAPSTSAKH